MTVHRVAAAIDRDRNGDGLSLLAVAASQGPPASRKRATLSGTAPGPGPDVSPRKRARAASVSGGAAAAEASCSGTQHDTAQIEAAERKVVRAAMPQAAASNLCVRCRRTHLHWTVHEALYSLDLEHRYSALAARLPREDIAYLWAMSDTPKLWTALCGPSGVFTDYEMARLMRWTMRMRPACLPVSASQVETMSILPSVCRTAVRVERH
jgi:hypothetical protein